MFSKFAFIFVLFFFLVYAHVLRNRFILSLILLLVAFQIYQNVKSMFHSCLLFAIFLDCISVGLAMDIAPKVHILYCIAIGILCITIQAPFGFVQCCLTIQKTQLKGFHISHLIHLSTPSSDLSPQGSRGYIKLFWFLLRYCYILFIIHFRPQLLW